MLNKNKDLMGCVFGRFTVVSFSGKNARGDRLWLCKCKCGKQKIIQSRYLGKIKSCGCARDEKRESEKIGKIYKTTYGAMKIAAQRRGKDFLVTHQYLWDLFLSQNESCAITGLPLHFGQGKLATGRTASLDRIDSSVGYIVGNVQWLHRNINLMKQEMSQNEFIEMCRLVCKNFTGHC